MVTFATGDPITIGNPAVPGANTLTTWGIPVVDPPMPFPSTMLGSVDPLTIWKTQPSVRKVVDFIARNVASVPWHAYLRVSDTDRKRVADSPAEQKLSNPRRLQTGYRMWRDVIIDSCLYDLWCVVYVGDHLQRISPRLLKVEADMFGNITAVGINTPRGVFDITDLPIAIGTGWSPTGGVGVSPMVTLRALLEEQANAVAWRASLWRNGPKLSGYITRPVEGSKWDSATRDRFVESWKRWRDTNAGGTPILEDGMEYKPLADVKPADAKDIEGRQLTDSEVASAFHIAPELVGAREGTFSNVAAFRQMLFGPALGPRLEELQQAVNLELVPSLDTRAGLYVELDREAAMNGSFAEQAQILSTSIGGPWLTRNEGRAKQNLPAVEGGDQLITPLNVTEGGLASPRDTGEQNRDLNALKALTVLKAASDDERERLSKAIQRVYKQQIAAINSGETVDVDEFHEQWDKIMSDAVHAHLFGTAVDEAQKVLAQLKAPSGTWSADVMRNYVQEMADTTASGVNAGVVETVNSFDWEADDGNGLATILGVAATAWAAAALTEAAGFGGHDAAKAAGAKSKTWNVYSSNPRPSHARLGGETVPTAALFSNGLRWPGDRHGNIDEVAGCTCGLTYTF